MDINYFTYDGVTSSSLSTYISGEGTYNAPERAYELISIPGKNGALAIDEKRFENIELTYPAFLFTTDEADFEAKVAELRNQLMSRTGYKVLKDTYHPNEYRLAIYKNGLDVEPELTNRAAKIELVFDCKPQRFLLSGEETITLTESSEITNPTLFEAKPLIEVAGVGTVILNGVSINISQSPVTIDCEAMEAYYGNVSRNSDIVLEPNRFPVLSPGVNSISLTSGITEVKITPRWWRI